MNREEIQWIIENLFVGNRLVARRGELGRRRRSTCATSARRSSCSPRSATTSRRRSRRSTGSPTCTLDRGDQGARPGDRRAVHESVGHLGIFVSGKVAKKEHTQIVSVLKTIEALPPGLYGMEISEQGPGRTRVRSKSTSIDWRMRARGSTARLTSGPSKPSPRCRRSTSTSTTCSRGPGCKPGTSRPRTMRQFHPLRLPRWAISDLNPWLWWLPAPPSGQGKPPAARRRAMRCAAPRRASLNSRARRSNTARAVRRVDRGPVLPRLRQPLLVATWRTRNPRRRPTPPSRASCPW